MAHCINYVYLHDDCSFLTVRHIADFSHTSRYKTLIPIEPLLHTKVTVVTWKGFFVSNWKKLFSLITFSLELYRYFNNILFFCLGKVQFRAVLRSPRLGRRPPPPRVRRRLPRLSRLAVRLLLQPVRAARARQPQRPPAPPLRGLPRALPPAPQATHQNLPRRNTTTKTQKVHVQRRKEKEPPRQLREIQKQHQHREQRRRAQTQAVRVRQKEQALTRIRLAQRPGTQPKTAQLKHD